MEQAAVSHLVGERVLEGVLEIGEELRLVDELGRLQAGQAAPQLVLGVLGDLAGARSTARSLPMTDATWRRRLSSAASRSMRAARIAWTVAGIWIAPAILASRYAPRSPTSTSSLDEGPHALLEEERVALRALDEQVPDRLAAPHRRPSSVSEELASALSGGRASIRSCR